MLYVCSIYVSMYVVCLVNIYVIMYVVCLEYVCKYVSVYVCIKKHGKHCVPNHTTYIRTYLHKYLQLPCFFTLRAVNPCKSGVVLHGIYQPAKTASWSHPWSHRGRSAGGDLQSFRCVPGGGVYVLKKPIRNLQCTTVREKYKSWVPGLGTVNIGTA